MGASFEHEVAVDFVLTTTTRSAPADTTRRAGRPALHWMPMGRVVGVAEHHHARMVFLYESFETVRSPSRSLPAW